MTFDKESFAGLLEKAKGYRSINQYARDAGVSPAHISRLLREMIDTPPSPEIISKLSHKAYNCVTYNELMISAGHIPHHDNKQPSDKKEKQDSFLEKDFLTIIIPTLYQGECNWTIEKNTEMSNGPDLIIRLSNHKFSDWYIDLMCSPLDGIQDIFKLYGKACTMKLTPEIKFTIAVDAYETYMQIKETPPRSLRGNIFVMLVDCEAKRIVKEERLGWY